MKKFISLEDEYHMRICERDAAWEAFCRCAQESTWDIYERAEKAEQAAKLAMEAGAIAKAAGC